MQGSAARVMRGARRMKDKAPKAKPDEDSSQQPRQQHTPSAKEQNIIETEDRIKERENLSEKSDDKSRAGKRPAP
jgi:hypothetical protein